MCRACADAVNVSKVEVLVDNVTDGAASYGDPRPDVQMADPDSPLNVGFSYSLNTARYLDGPHRIYVRVTDSREHCYRPQCSDYLFQRGLGCTARIVGK